MVLTYEFLPAVIQFVCIQYCRIKRHGLIRPHWEDPVLDFRLGIRLSHLRLFLLVS
jgi:hypothetical protein